MAVWPAWRVVPGGVSFAVAAAGGGLDADVLLDAVDVAAAVVAAEVAAADVAAVLESAAGAGLELVLEDDADWPPPLPHPATPPAPAPSTAAPAPRAALRPVICPLVIIGPFRCLALPAASTDYG